MEGDSERWGWKLLLGLLIGKEDEGVSWYRVVVKEWKKNLEGEGKRWQ